MTKRSKLLHWPGSSKFKTACGRELVPDRISHNQSKVTCASCLRVISYGLPKRKSREPVGSKPLHNAGRALGRDLYDLTMRQPLVRGIDALLEVVTPPNAPKPLHEWVEHSKESPNVIAMLREMFEAEDAYGTGFYSDERWLKAYRALASFAGLREDYGTGKYVPLWPTPPTLAQLQESGHLPPDLEVARDVIRDLQEVLNDKRRLTRELDIAMHGEESAAKQASLADLIESAKRMRAVIQAAQEFLKAGERWETANMIAETRQRLREAVERATPTTRG